MADQYYPIRQANRRTSPGRRGGTAGAGRLQESWLPESKASRTPQAAETPSLSRSPRDRFHPVSATLTRNRLEPAGVRMEVGPAIEEPKEESCNHRLSILIGLTPELSPTTPETLAHRNFPDTPGHGNADFATRTDNDSDPHRRSGGRRSTHRRAQQLSLRRTPTGFLSQAEMRRRAWPGEFSQVMKCADRPQDSGSPLPVRS